MRMKEIYILTVSTSLPEVCRGSEDIQTKKRAFDSFEKARAASALRARFLTQKTRRQQNERSMGTVGKNVFAGNLL